MAGFSAKGGFGKSFSAPRRSPGASLHVFLARARRHPGTAKASVRCGPRSGGRPSGRAGPLLGDARSVAGRAGRRGVSDEMVDVILQLRPPHFQFVNFLVRGEIYLLLDAIDRVVEAVIFVKHFPEVLVSAFQSLDGVTMFRKLS